MLKTAVASRKGGVTRHGSFHYEGAPPGRGDKNNIVSYPENVVPDQKVVLTDDSRTVISRHESFLSEKEKTFFRLKEPLLGKKVNICYIRSVSNVRGFFQLCTCQKYVL